MLPIPLDLFLATCACACYTDIRWRRVPNPLTFGALAGVLAVTAPEGIASVAFCLLAIVVTIVAGSVPFRLGLIGGGDVKLLAVGAATIGFPDFLITLLYVACAGGVLASLYALREGRLRTVWTHVALSALNRTRVVPVAGSRRIPYALAIGAGSLCYVASESVAPWFRAAH